MSITFDQIPRDTLNPGGYLEFDQSLAGSLVDPPRVLLVGHKLATGTQPDHQITRISTAKDAGVKFGASSMLHEVATLALKVSKSAELYAVSVDTLATATDTASPDIDSLLTALGDDRYDYIMLPYHDITSVSLISDELDRRWNAMVARESRAFVVVPFGYDDGIAFAATLNSPHINVLPIGVGTPEKPHLWNTVLTCVMADKLNNDPAAPETDTVLPYITPPATEFTTRQRNDLAHNGCGTWANNIDKVQIKYLVTTYRINPQGEADSAFRDIQVAEVLKKWRRYINFVAMRTYAGYKIAKDASLYGAGQKILDTDEFAGFLQTQYLNYAMREKGWFDDFENYRNTLIVEIDPDNQDRINYSGIPTIIGQFRVLAGKDRFVTF
jgi:phage tail sheath gpL-like